MIEKIKKEFQTLKEKLFFTSENQALFLSNIKKIEIEDKKEKNYIITFNDETIMKINKEEAKEIQKEIQK